MSRPLKFRAWSRFNQEWQTASFPPHHDDTWVITDFFRLLLKGDLEHQCESTGICDKTGKEIYEDDIIGFGNCGVGRVVNGLDLKDSDNDPNYNGFLIRCGRTNHLFEWGNTKETLEVLANIHEHPDLLV